MKTSCWRYYILFVFSLLYIITISACKPGKHTLPIEGPIRLAGKDTIYHTIANFSFKNQEGKIITQDDLSGKVYVADFFFVSCPTICKDMARNMKLVYDKFKNHKDFMILSHTIDPEHDSIPRLKAYSEKLQVEAPTWQFLTGLQKDIYSIGQNSYRVTATKKDNEMGAYLHDGSFILIDQEGRIRGVYDGTNPQQVALLIADIPILFEK